MSSVLFVVEHLQEAKNPLMWRTIDLTLHTSRFNLPIDSFTKICCSAIKRSRGHLEEFSVEYFGTDDLLKCIADSTSHLRRLGLPSCMLITEEGLIEVVKKLPLLEELDISFNPKLTEDCLRVIGRSCPHLKALKFKMLPVAPFATFCDEEAFAIAETMPELRNLQITAHYLTNEGLLAILDGCPLLEFLDLRACFNVDLSGNLGKRCCEQIKEIRLPLDFQVEISDDPPSFMSLFWAYKMYFS